MRTRPTTTPPISTNQASDIRPQKHRSPLQSKERDGYHFVRNWPIGAKRFDSSNGDMAIAAVKSSINRKYLSISGSNLGSSSWEKPIKWRCERYYWGKQAEQCGIGLNSLFFTNWKVLPMVWDAHKFVTIIFLPKNLKLTRWEMRCQALS